MVGQLQIDYSGLLAAQQVQFKVGQIVAVAGSQAAAGAPLTATKMFVVPAGN
jgi:hypothetical protein